jgi:hypothetical protein
MCCDHWQQKGNFTPPIARMIIVEWYDGPVTGAAICGDCGAEFAFRMVASDDNQTMRIYTLADLQIGQFERLSSAFASAGPPKWPVWWPAHFSSDKERDAAWRQAQTVLAAAAPPTCVVAAEELEKKILRASPVPRDEETPPESDRAAFAWWMARMHAA